MLRSDDPRHGTRAGYLAGCRRPECMKAHRAYCKRYRARKIIEGRDVTTPASTVVPHLVDLRQTMSLGAIAESAGTCSSHIHRILGGETKRVTNDMAARLLAVRPHGDLGTKWVSARGAARRLQSLVAMGHSFPRIDDRLGYGRQNLYLVAHGQRTSITSVWDFRIRGAWEEMSMSLPNPVDKYQRAAVTRALAAAAAHGWLPPLAWDDIDDMTERPNIGRERMNYRADELLSEWDHLRHAGVNLENAAKQLGVSNRAIEKAVERAGKAVA